MEQSMIADYLRYIEEKHSDKTAFSFTQKKDIIDISYSDFVSDVKRFASRLTAEYPDIHSRHIGLLAKNSYSYITALFGIWLAGGVAVTLNTDEPANVLLEQIRFADIDCIFSDEAFLTSVFDSAEDVPCTVRWLDGYANDWQTEVLVTGKALDEPILMLFTSGTTSRSKCVLHSQKTLFSHMHPFLPESGVQTVLFINPLFHMVGINGLIGWLYSGCSLTINISMKYLFRDLQKCEQVYAVPSIMEYIRKNLARNGRNEVGDLKVVFTGGAPMRADTIQTFYDNGIGIYQDYSLSEAAGRGTTNPMTDSRKITSVGQADEGTEISIQDGEICLKSDNVMLGYYKNPEATAEAIRDGWLHTGDMGYLDEDGYLFITGRKKNLIILDSGENISPERIEALLSQNELVREVVVKEKNHQVCAEIFCEEADQADIRAWIEKVNQSLAYYQHITLVEFRSEPFEKTASGKIKRPSVSL